ncbi:sn1-specific diacylglycerol lipase alpha [Vigna unguiculata]|uniref:Sn1-specific diacylglycerol lipase alpha n=1 Tax=Vigna unguiculata TaxID=3917 RepID=A0A4D6KZY5_VIGUN|nr:sn1-specific diacylglycerol lipase alpha [Vigna unguiculata]
MANGLGMLSLHQRNATELRVPRKEHSHFLSHVSVSHTQAIFQTPIYVSIFLLLCLTSLCTFFFSVASMTAGAMATAAGAAVTLYLLLRRRKKAEEEWSRARTLRVRPAQAPANLFESIVTLSETLRFTYSETIGKWPIADLAFGINSFMRKQGDLAVASVYGGSGCVELKGPEVVADLEELLRLLTLCMLFSKKPFPDFLDSAGFSQDHVLLQSPKAELLKPAFTIIHDMQSRCFLLLIRGTHSIKDTLTAATGAMVPFHHSILSDGQISNLVLGHAHCGMVAAARWIAKLCTPTLLKALNECPDSKVKVVGHSLGGGTASLLTYILREQNELSSTTCVTFAPAACMTWELAESGKHFITTIINNSDMVPTLSSFSVDDLRSEVAASSWLNDLWNQVEHTKVLNVIYRSASTLGSHLQSISSAKDKVTGVGAILLPVASSTQVVIKHAQSVAKAVVKTMAKHSQNIGPLSKSKLNNLVKVSLEPENISKSLLTESVSVLNKDEPNSTSGKSEPDVADEDKLVIDDNEHITEGELWHELEKELEKQTILNILTQIEEAAAEKEIIEEENQLVNASNSISTSDLVDNSYCFYPPGKIMHMVSAPSDESSSNSKEEHIKLYETPRQLYSKFRLSKKMINDHYMPTYRTMIQQLIQELKKDGVKQY